MDTEKIEELYQSVVTMWRVFKKLLDNYKPTEEFIAGTVKWLTPENEKNSFQADLGWVMLSELYREYYKEDPLTDLILVLRATEEIERKYGVKVTIRMTGSDGVEKEMEAAS